MVTNAINIYMITNVISYIMLSIYVARGLLHVGINSIS